MITSTIPNYSVAPCFVDGGSSTDILSKRAFQEIGLEDKDLKVTVSTLYGFLGKSISPKGRISLFVMYGEEGTAQTTII